MLSTNDLAKVGGYQIANRPAASGCRGRLKSEQVRRAEYEIRCEGAPCQWAVLVGQAGGAACAHRLKTTVARIEADRVIAAGDRTVVQARLNSCPPPSADSFLPGSRLPGSRDALIKVERLRSTDAKFPKVRVKRIQQVIPFFGHDCRRHFQHRGLAALQPFAAKRLQL